MRFILLVLLSVPVAMATNCWEGKSENDKDDFKSKPCADDWCYKNDVTTDKQHGIAKGCGNRGPLGQMCKVDGCAFENIGGGCCCKGELCNAAAGNSLLMTSLIAAAAACLRG